MTASSFRRLSSADANTTVTVEDADVTLDRITVNTTSAHALTVKDGTGRTVAVLKASVAEGTYEYRVPCVKGLAIEVPASYAGDATVCWH